MQPVTEAFSTTPLQLRDERFLPRFHEARRIRLLMVGLVWVLVIAANLSAGIFAAPWAAHLLVVSALMNEVLARVLARRVQTRALAWWLTSLLESVLLTYTFHLLGSSDSPLLPLFLVQILAVSLLGHGTLGVWVAVADVLLVMGTTFAVAMGWSVPGALFTVSVGSPAYATQVAALGVLRVLTWGGALLLTAYVSGYVATLLREGEQASLTRENRELAALRRISRAVATEQPLPEMMPPILMSARQYMESPQVYLLAPESFEGPVRFFASAEQGRDPLGRQLAERGTALPPMGELRQRIAELLDDEPFLILDDFGDLVAALGLPLEEAEVAELQRRQPRRRYLLAPLRAEGHVTGLLALAAPRPVLQDDDVRNMQLLTNEVGRALHLAQLRQARTSLTTALQRRNAQLGQILALTNELRLDLPDNELLQRVVEGVRATLGIELVVLSVIERGELRTAAWSGRAEQLPPQMMTQINRELLRPENQVGRSYLLRGVAGPPLRPGEPWREGDRLIVPIEVRGRLLGYLSIGGEAGSRAPGQSMVETLEVMAGQAGLALQNARLFQEAADERSRLNAILAASVEPIIAMNSEGEVLLMNEAAGQALGLPVGQALGRRLDGPPFPRALRSLLTVESNATLPITADIRLDDGRSFAVAVASLSGSRRAPRGWVVTMHDISHFKQLDQLKNDFVSTVSHDLRAPLTAISGYAYLLQQEPLSTDGQQSLGQIQVAVDRMTRLIRDLLDLGRIESGLGFNKLPLDMAVVLKAVVAEMQPAAQAKGISLRLYARDEALGLIMGDPDRLHQAVTNLVQNALKFTPSGGQVGIELERLTGSLSISVRDTGPGIPPTDQPYIFDKFYRVGQRTQEGRQAEGSGLGLAIVRSIVEQHGGRIELQSAVNSGTTIRIVLPTIASGQTG